MSDFLTELRGELLRAHAGRRRPPVRARLAAGRAGRPALAVVAVLLALAAAGLAVRALQDPSPAGPRVVERLSVAGTPVDAVFDGRTLWVGDGSRGRLAGIDPRSRRVTARAALPGPVTALAHDARDGLWVRTGVDASTRTVVSRLDPATGAAAPLVRTGLGGGLAVAAGTVWVAQVEAPPEVVDGHEAGTGARTHRLRLASVYGLAAAGDDVWGLVSDGTVLRIDGRRGRVLRRFPHVAASAGTSGDARALAADAGGLWLVAAGTGPGDGRLLRIGLDGRVRSFPAGGDAPLVWVVARAPDGVWTAAGDAALGEHRLERLDPRTGRVTARVALGEHRPVRLVVVGEELWVACQDGAVLVVASGAA